jgi:hypothetical protein
MPAAEYFLVDLTPVGGWKGNTWAILQWDHIDGDAYWYATRSEADVYWDKVRKESARQEREHQGRKGSAPNDVGIDS